MKWFLIKVLFKLIDVKDTPSDKGHLIDAWMADSWQNPGFRAYMLQRDRDFVRILSGGLGAVPLGQDDYKRFLGQRVELQRFGKKVKVSYEQTQKMKGLKIKKTQL